MMSFGNCHCLRETAGLGAVVAVDDQRGTHRPGLAGLDGQHAGVDLADARDILVSQELFQRTLRKIVRRVIAPLADDHGLGLDAGRLEVVGVDAVVADERIGEKQRLALVGRIG